MTNLITINKAVKNFKTLIDKSIKDGGNKEKTAMIRSSKPILNIHEAVKVQLIQNGVNEELIYPPLNSRTPELKLAGFLKQKDQDVCVTPNDEEATIEILKIGLDDILFDKNKIVVYGKGNKVRHNDLKPCIIKRIEL